MSTEQLTFEMPSASAPNTSQSLRRRWQIARCVKGKRGAMVTHPPKETVLKARPMRTTSMSLDRHSLRAQPHRAWWMSN